MCKVLARQKHSDDVGASYSHIPIVPRPACVSEPSAGCTRTGLLTPTLLCLTSAAVQLQPRKQVCSHQPACAQPQDLHAQQVTEPATARRPLNPHMLPPLTGYVFVCVSVSQPSQTKLAGWWLDAPPSALSLSSWLASSSQRQTAGGCRLLQGCKLRGGHLCLVVLL